MHKTYPETAGPLAWPFWALIDTMAASATFTACCPTTCSAGVMLICTPAKSLRMSTFVVNYNRSCACLQLRMRTAVCHWKDFFLIMYPAMHRSTTFSVQYCCHTLHSMSERVPQLEFAMAGQGSNHWLAVRVRVQHIERSIPRSAMYSHHTE